MNRLLAAVLAVVGLSLAAFAARIGFTGAEPEIPRGDDAIEGTLSPGPTVRGPVGEPFLYGEVRVQDADNTETNVGTIHYRSVHGSPRAKVRTDRGEVDVVLPAPGRWRVLDGTEAGRDVASLAGQPLVASIDVGDRLSPPFRLSARVVRPGDHVIVAKDESARVRLYVGERAALERQRAVRERGRMPIVGMLGLLAGVSLFVARRAAMGKLFDDEAVDEPEGA